MHVLTGLLLVAAAEAAEYLRFRARAHATQHASSEARWPAEGKGGACRRFADRNFPAYVVARVDSLSAYGTGSGLKVSHNFQVMAHRGRGTKHPARRRCG